MANDIFTKVYYIAPVLMLIPLALSFIENIFLQVLSWAICSLAAILIILLYTIIKGLRSILSARKTSLKRIIVSFIGLTLVILSIFEVEIARLTRLSKEYIHIFFRLLINTGLLLLAIPFLLYFLRIRKLYRVSMKHYIAGILTALFFTLLRLFLAPKFNPHSLKCLLFFTLSSTLIGIFVFSLITASLIMPRGVITDVFRWLTYILITIILAILIHKRIHVLGLVMYHKLWTAIFSIALIIPLFMLARLLDKFL